MKDITSTITKPLAVLGENGKGYTKEANFISWNGNAAKLDIREWHPNHERCGKGITLTEDEEDTRPSPPLCAVFFSSLRLLVGS